MSAAWDARSGRSAKFVRRSLRLAIYLRDGFDCVFCAGVFPLGRDLTLDHVVPRTDGGSNLASNLVTACFACNFERQNTPLRARELRRAAAACAKPVDRAAALRLLRGGWNPEFAAACAKLGA